MIPSSLREPERRVIPLDKTIEEAAAQNDIGDLDPALESPGDAVTNIQGNPCTLPVKQDVFLWIGVFDVIVRQVNN